MNAGTLEFHAGDTVRTKEDEQDIEVIPRGTIITLTRSGGNGFWWGTGEINKNPRVLLVRSDNIELV